MRARRLGAALTALIATGCVTYERGEFAALSTTRPQIPLTIVAENVEGRACGSLFDEPLLRAIDDAVARTSGANALVDVSYQMERLCIVVRGTAVQIP